uniref:Uncharacterized protein n=1 Tax=Anopheles christyi TaxID=43041 RepID=A0A182JT25_9DIPT
MKFLLLSLFLCILVTASTAQTTTTRSPVIAEMQLAIGKMLMLVRDLSAANSAFTKDTGDQTALNTLYTTSEELYQLFSVFSSAKISTLSLGSRDRVNQAMSSFRNSLTAWETAMDQRSATELARTFKEVENAFLMLGGVVFSL